MQLEKHKKHIIASVIISFILITIVLIVFWNSFISGKSSPGIWPFIIYFITILILVYIINLVIVSLNPKEIDAIIEKEVSEERVRILKEFENKEQKKEVKDTQEYLTNKKSAIVPKGNFKNIDSFLDKLFKNIIKELEFIQGIVYLRVNKSNNFKFLSGFAITSDDKPSFKVGENLTGQVAETKEISVIDEIPEDYFSVESGLGSSKPKLLLIVPVLVKDKVVAVFEFASFKDFDESIKEIILMVLTEISDKLEQLTKA